MCVSVRVGSGCVGRDGFLFFFLTGSLGSVSNLETVNSSIHINVSWIAPFTLDVTDEDPHIWYSVIVNNVTDEENPTTVPCTDCHNLTQTHYVFISDYPSPCHKYTFTIIPYNEVGKGETSENVTGYFINSEFCVQSTCITHSVCTHDISRYSYNTHMHYGAYKLWAYDCETLYSQRVKTFSQKIVKGYWDDKISK